MKFVVASKESAPFKEGRRKFFKYRDLGVTAASNGSMRADVQFATQGMSKPTGWHYHECEQQLVYVLQGWIELQFEDGTTQKIEEGGSLFIPPGFRHNEIHTSDFFEIIEVSVPAAIGTVPCDPPPGWDGDTFHPEVAAAARNPTA
ncbi:cupin domain-containing protein [Hydrogenophaga sp. BPS33]|uniref:cupin domain-containing protein n=1 Tax=Hydrogenophaga sp. BPS33 TaxID=2651974 RepID=UPI0013597172|nr:cupin domain-containing protein [Hydrogenophaga sp. BPS33]